MPSLNLPVHYINANGDIIPDREHASIPDPEAQGTVAGECAPLETDVMIPVEYIDHIDRPKDGKGTRVVIPTPDAYDKYGEILKSRQFGHVQVQQPHQRASRQRMHSIPFPIPPGQPVAWTSLTLPSGKVISTYKVGDGEPQTQEGYTFGPSGPAPDHHDSVMNAGEKSSG